MRVDAVRRAHLESEARKMHQGGIVPKDVLDLCKDHRVLSESAERMRSTYNTLADEAVGASMLSLDREALGRVVREVWIAWAREQLNPKPSWLAPWEDLGEPDREVDRCIGERLAAIGTLAGREGPR